MVGARTPNRIDRPATREHAWDAWHRACQVGLPAGVAAGKRAAVGVLASQLADRGPDAGPVLPVGIVAHFTRPEEVLLR